MLSGTRLVLEQCVYIIHELEGEGRALRGWQMMPRRLKQSPLPIIKHQQSDKGRVNPHTHNSVLGLSGIRVRV